jgi:hypothetical protein
MDHLSSFHPSNLLHTQEAIRQYRPGGFHSVRLDDTFKDGRYQVRHKLGWGGGILDRWRETTCMFKLNNLIPRP